MSDDAAPGYHDECDVCNETVGMYDQVTVPWANVVFCSQSCRDRWTTAQDRNLR